MFADLIKMKGLLETDTLTRVQTSSIRRKWLPVRLVKHTLGKEKALRIAVLLVLEVRFALAEPYTVTKSDKYIFRIKIE